MTNECKECGDRDHESNLVYQVGGGYLCKFCNNVNRPSHYQGKGFEVINIIEDFGLNFHLGNAIKYILRAGKKGDRVEDIRKAIWYLKREIGDAKEESRTANQ